MDLAAITSYLCLGSNLGDRDANLNMALDFLSHRLCMAKVSSVYETEPVGNTDQPYFLNLVCQVATTLSPTGLISLAKGIEAKMGRLPGKPNSPRPIDIDILLYGDQIIETPELIIPHPRMAERAFVLVPLAEIAPQLVHPVSGRTVKELLAALDDSPGVFRLR